MSLYKLKPGDTAYLRQLDQVDRSVCYVPVKVARVLKTQIVLEDGRRYQRNTGDWSGTPDNRVLRNRGLQVYGTRLVTEDDPGYQDSLHPDEWAKAKRKATDLCSLWTNTGDRDDARAALAALASWIDQDVALHPQPATAKEN